MKKKNDSGQALVEIAISLFIFLLLAMGTIDFAIMFNHKLTLQNAVRQAGRYAITGQCIVGSNGTCGMSRFQSIITILENASVGLINSSNEASDVFITCTPGGPGGCPNQAGGPGDLVTIRVTYPHHFITPLIAPFFRNQPLTINVSTTFTNEPFPPGSS
jgi:Flp pilus assembly protein TadG